MLLTISHPLLPKSPSAHASLVMDHFGIGFETGRHVIADNLDLPILPGDLVCFTGASGSGKSSLMRAAARQLENLLDIDSLDLGDRILVDALDLPAHRSLQLLATCGLGEARLLLRNPHELSDGQRYRFRLALALARNPRWILADEFTATLDRTLAKVIACNIRRLASRTGTGFLLATTHEDILDDLNPSLHVACRLDGRIDVDRHDVKKKVSSASPAISGSAPAPSPTGRTSLAGITALTTPASPASSPSSGTVTNRSASASSHRHPSPSPSATATSASHPSGPASSSVPSTARSSTSPASSCTPPTAAPASPQLSSATPADSLPGPGSKPSPRWAT